MMMIQHNSVHASILYIYIYVYQMIGNNPLWQCKSHLALDRNTFVKSAKTVALWIYIYMLCATDVGFYFRFQMNATHTISIRMRVNKMDLFQKH